MMHAIRKDLILILTLCIVLGVAFAVLISVDTKFNTIDEWSSQFYHFILR